MVWFVGSAALAQQAIVAIEVRAPDGTVAMQDELVLPSERILRSPDGKHSVQLSVRALDGNRAAVDLVAGPLKDGKPKPKVTKTFELDPFAEQTQVLIYKSSTWPVSAKLGLDWDQPAAVPVEDTNRYVLVWDDAPMVADPKDTKTPPVVERALPARSDALTQASPMRFIDAFGQTHLQLETVPSPGPAHCQAGGPPIEPFAVSSYVQLKDLIPKVTSREIAAKLPDGTGYRVAAGVPVVPEGEGTWRVQTGGLSFLIQATEDDLAFYYRPSAHFTATPPATMRVKPGVVGRTALGDVTWAGPEPLPVAGLHGAAAPIAVLQVPCAEVRVAADPVQFLK